MRALGPPEAPSSPLLKPPEAQNPKDFEHFLIENRTFLSMNIGGPEISWFVDHHFGWNCFEFQHHLTTVKRRAWGILRCPKLELHPRECGLMWAGARWELWRYQALPISMEAFGHGAGHLKLAMDGNGMAAWVKILHPDAWFETRNDAFVCFCLVQIPRCLGA